MTTSNEHMHEALSMHAYDYIEKPATRERIFNVLDDILALKTSTSDEPAFCFKSEGSDLLRYFQIFFLLDMVV